MNVPYARFFTPPLRGGSFPLPRAKDVVKTSVFTRPLKRDSSTPILTEQSGAEDVCIEGSRARDVLDYEEEG